VLRRHVDEDGEMIQMYRMIMSETQREVSRRRGEADPDPGKEKRMVWAGIRIRERLTGLGYAGDKLYSLYAKTSREMYQAAGLGEHPLRGLPCPPVSGGAGHALAMEEV
jgi:hypothetical protein